MARPVHPEYAKRFCKQIVKVVEAEDSEVGDSVYNAIQLLYTQQVHCPHYQLYWGSFKIIYSFRMAIYYFRSIPSAYSIYKVRKPRMTKIEQDVRS